jgi:hypothetical protein
MSMTCQRTPTSWFNDPREIFTPRCHYLPLTLFWRNQFWYTFLQSKILARSSCSRLAWRAWQIKKCLRHALLTTSSGSDKSTQDLDEVVLILPEGSSNPDSILLLTSIVIIAKNNHVKANDLAEKVPPKA